MTGIEVVVVVAAALAVVGLGWFFFGPRRVRMAEVSGGVQRVRVRVAGGYAPDVIRMRQGLPMELVFDRQETGECTSQVVFPDLAVSAALPAYAQTTVRLRPQRAGTFGLACGMNMIHGTLIVEPADTAHSSGDATDPPSAGTRPGAGPDAADAEAEQAAYRLARPYAIWPSRSR